MGATATSQLASTEQKLEILVNSLPRLLELQQSLVDFLNITDKEYVEEYNSIPNGTVCTVNPKTRNLVRIEGIIVATASGVGAVNLQLGDRNIPIPAGAVVVLSPVNLRLNQSDVRQLTCATAGQLFVHLSGKQIPLETL